MKYAIKSDLKNIKVPVKGDIQEVVTSMSAKMLIYNTLVNSIDDYLVHEAHMILDRGIRPMFQICEKIALHRKDLAFDAGRLYERSNFY